MQGLNPNIIGGNGRHGVEIYGWMAARNVIRGNFIGGRDQNGNSVPGNGESGVFVDCYARSNVIAGNVIEHNGEDGITVCGSDNSLGKNSTEGNRRVPVEVITPTPPPRP